MATTPTKIDWVLMQHARLSPLWDLGKKFCSALLVLSVPATLALWTFFSDYLGHIGQSSLPAKDVGDWGFLLLFSASAALVFAAMASMPSLWLASVWWNVTGTSPDKLRKQALAVSIVSLAIVMIAFLNADRLSMQATLVLLTTAVILGGLSGAVVVKLAGGGFWKAALLHVGTAIVMLLWLISIWLLLAPAVVSYADGQASATFTLIVMTVLLVASCLAHPAFGGAVAILLTGFWTFYQASPESGILIPRALYVANLGGGRPAHIEQGMVKGEICNLGVDARPVLVLERRGCEWEAAVARLRALRDKSSLDRKNLLHGWAEEVRIALGEAKSVPPARSLERK